MKNVAARSARANPAAARQPITVFPEKIPTDLRQFGQWVVWRYGKPRSSNGKPPKEPIDPRTGALADPTDPASWRSFAEAMAVYRAGGYAGIGVVLSANDPFTALDLDNCRNPDTGQIAAWAQQIIDALQSYSEVSPSGTGVRVMVAGKKPGGRCRRGSVEMYDQDRYVTMTGHHLAGTPESIESRQQELEAVHREYLEPAGSSGTKAQAVAAVPASLSDQQVIAKASHCRNGHMFRALFFDSNVTAYRSDSEADCALAAWLAYYCGPDPERIIKLMKQSALCREKWYRSDYLQRTVAVVLEKQQRFYKPPRRRQEGECPLYSVMNTVWGEEHIQNKADIPACPVYFQPAVPCRRQGPRRHLRSTQNPGLEAALRLPCGRRNCVSCSQAVKQKWMERLHFGIHRLEMTLLHAWAGSKSQWKTVSRLIRRKKGRYLGIRHGQEHSELFLLCTIPLVGSEEITVGDAMSRMAEKLKRLRGFKGGNKGRTLVCSRPWPKPPKPRKWVREGDVPASSRSLDSTLLAEMARNADFRGVILEPGQAALMDFSRLPEPERAKVRDRILGHTLPMSSAPLSADDFARKSGRATKNQCQ